MGRARTHRKNLQKRKKRRLFAQLNHVISQNDPAEMELEYMQAEETSQRTHEKWVQANEQMDLKLKKKRKIENAKKRLLNAIRQQMKEEKKDASDEKQPVDSIKQKDQSMNEEKSIALMVQEVQAKAYQAMFNATTAKNPSLSTKICTLYGRTGCCPSGDNCKRSHVSTRPGRFLLLKRMFDATSMNTREFYVDVYHELKKKNPHILRIEIAMNQAPHLLGNVYIEYKSPQDARQAFASIKHRWYAKKKIQATIVDIDKWEFLLCGGSLREACPRGVHKCNYLHSIKPIPSVTELDRQINSNTAVIGFHEINAYFDRTKS